MFRHLLPTAALIALTTLPLSSYAVDSEEFLEGTGTACLATGAVVGVVALLTGPAALAMVAGTAMMPVAVSTGLSSMLGCGAGATGALGYYGYRWGDEKLFEESPYPDLYPLREEISDSSTAH